MSDSYDLKYGYQAPDADDSIAPLGWSLMIIAAVVVSLSGLLCVASAVADAAVEPPIVFYQQWETLVETIESGNGTWADTLWVRTQRHANRRGLEGWQIADVDYRNGILTFKRPVHRIK